MEDTILEKFYNYWQLLPSSAENINNQIYLDISFYIKKNQNDKKSKSTVVAVVLETHLQEFFEINLIKYPYPICQILQLLPENVITENIFTNCLVKLCTHGVEQQTETNGSSIIITNTAVVPNDIETLKILNLLLHFNEKHFCKIANICIPNIWKLFIENSPQTKKISNDLFLCLCARNDNGQLLQLFLDYDDNKQQEQQHKITNNFFNKKYIFMETIKNQKHFLNELIAKPLEYHRIQLKRHKNQLKQTKMDYGTDDTIIPTIMLIKVLQLIHDHETIITNDMNYKEILNIINDELMDQSHNALLYHQDTFQQIILLELKRFLMVQNVLNTNYKKHYFQLNSTMFSSKYSIIDFIFMMPSTSSSSCNNDLSSSAAAAAADQQYNVNYEYIYSILIDNLQYNKTIDKLYLKYINKLNNEMKNPPMNNNTKTDKDNDNNNNNNNELYTELDFCAQYFIIRIFIDILFLHNSSNVNKNNMNNNNSIDIDNNNMNKQTTSNVITMENYEAAMMIKFYDIKKYIRNIQSFHCYVELLEILFSLIFLRWEHINENYYDIDFDRTVESGSECTEDDDASSSLKNPTTNEIIDGNRKNTIQKESSKYGFICTNIVLEQFLQLLKTIVTQKKHSEAYQLASTDLQCRFATLHEQINDAQWRLTLFSGTSSSSPPSKTIIFNSTSNNTDLIKCDVNNQNTDNNIQILQNITKYLNSYKIIDVYPQQIRKLSTDDDDDDDDDNDDDNDDNVDDDVDDEGDCDDEQDNYIDNKNNNNILDNNFKISSTTSTGTTTTTTTTTTSTSIHQNKNNNNKLQQSTMMTKRKLRKKSAKKFDSSEKGFFSHSTDNERKNSCTKLPNYDVQQQQQQKPQQQIEHPNIDEQHKKNNKQMYNIIKSKRNIINKMLGTSENLISICLCNGDMETARQIIKNNNLENSAIAIEIGFLEMLTNTKQKLREIFDKYKKQDLSSVGKKFKKLEKISQQEQEHQPQQQQPTSTTTHSSDQSSHSNVKLINSLERIRKIASVGFEISKITNIMENFAITSQLHECRTDMKQILEKYLVQYKNLLQFKNEQIQSTILIDLIISLSNNYDICLNIYDLLTKLWKLNDNKIAEELIIDGSTKLSINQSQQQQQQQFKSAQGPGPTVPVPPQITINNDFTINFNPLNTLKIFIECLKQYKNIAKEHFGIEHLLYEECCYKLRSNDIQIHLEKEQLFKQLAGITFNELNTIDKLKLHLKSFNQLKCCDLNYFNRIYGFIVNASRLLQFNESSHCKKSDVDLNENNQSNKNINNNNNNNNKTPLEILNLNLIQLIGEIIFEKQINPIEIENILFNMNINLLYAIILNVCEPIANKNPNNNNDQNTNNYYLNSLIAEFNLNDDDDEITYRKKFNFNNLMIIEKQNQGKLYKLCDNVNNLIIIDYVKKHNQLIAYLLQEIHAVHPKSSQNHVVIGDITQSQSKKLDGQSSMGVSKGSTTTTTKEMNTHFNNKSSSSYFQNLMNTNEIQVYSLIYNNNNNAWAALNYDVFNVYDLIMYIKRTGDLRIPLEIIQNYKDIDYNRNYLLLNRLKDLLIIEMLNNDTDDKQIREESSSVVDISGSTNDEEDQDDQDDDDENDYLNYKTQHNPNLNITIIEQITDINLQANILIKKFNTINSGELVIRLIRNILLHQNVSKLNDAIHQQLKTQLENINIYLQIQEIFPDKNKKTWLEIKKISNELPECILEMLIEYGEYELCYEWSKIHPLRNYMDKYSEFIIIFTTEILQENPKNTILFKLIESLPKERVFHFYNKMLIGHRNIKLLNYLIDYLIKSSTTSTSTSSVSGTMNTNLNVYQKYRISLKIFEMLSESTDTVSVDAAAAAVDERDRLWNLISAPALIIEQYIMNSKFDMLKKILDKIRPLLNEIKCDYCLKQTKSNQTIKHHKKSSSYDSTKINKSKLKVVNVSGDAPQPTPATMNRNNKNNTDDNHTDMNLKFNLYEHSLGIECIDALLRVYASKALDFRIISDGGAYTHASAAAAAASSSSSSTDQSSMDMTSLDSLCGIFVMPKEPPKKQQWIRDSDATHCMCCRRAVFTMLTRRHHCRRCGRVVCHACSRKRITITNLYADILVRICDDCNKQTDLINVKLSKVNQSQPPNVIQQSTVNKSIVDYNIEWEFSGNPKHDNLLRDEFCYEFAPSVSLCLNILEFHSPTPAYVKFLLYYCKKFERLLRPIQPGFPNPEIDYILVTRMLHCLSLAAKVRGGPPECDIIRDHSEIIRSIVNNGCESLLPMESPNCSSFRKLRDSLVIAEKWTLALDLSLKCGFTTTGVLATWGMACLRAGCFDTAREKFTYCMTKTTTDEEISKIKLIIIQECMSSLSSSSSSSQTGIKIKKGTNKKQSIIDVKSSIKVRRPVKSPPLLNEIINILEIMCHPIRLAVLTRASQIRDSNTSLASNKSKNKENIPIYEPSINILHTLSNLKQIAYGGGNLTGNVATIIGSSIDPQIHSSSTIPNNNNDDDDDGDEGIIAGTSKMSSITTKGSSSSAVSAAAAAAASAASVASSTLKPFDYERIKPNTKFYDECLYYLIAYGSHFDIVRFLIKHNQIFIALKYLLYQQIDCDIFLQLILMPNLKCGKLNVIIAYMLELDETLLAWKQYIVHTCRYLERKHLLNSLYHLQMLLKDPVRASMTCVKFYSMDAHSYKDLLTNSYHLLNAQQHLQAELDLCQWEEIKVHSSMFVHGDGHGDDGDRDGDGNEMMNRSMEEEVRSLVMKMDSKTLNVHISTIWRQIEVTKFLTKCELNNRETVGVLPKIFMDYARLPTLFGSLQEKIQLTVLTIVCGINVEEGFGLAYRIIQDFNLNMIKVYGITAKYLVTTNRINDVEKLIDCIRGNNQRDAQICDEILCLAVETAVRKFGTQIKMIIDNLIRLINDVGMKINCHIVTGQLKSAYLLAVQQNRIDDIRKVLKHAELTNQIHVKRLCEKKLNLLHSTTVTVSNSNRFQLNNEDNDDMSAGSSNNSENVHQKN